MWKSTRGIRALTVFLVSAALLSGCGGAASDGPVPSTTAELYEQAMANREKFWKELDDMEKVVGGEWENTDSRTSDSCPGDMREDYYYFRGFRHRTEPVEDIHAAGDAMQKYWDDIGYTTGQISYAKDHLIVAAKDKSGWEIYLESEGTGAEKHTSLSGNTGCFHGDSGLVLRYEIQWDKDHPQPTPTLSKDPNAPETPEQ